MSSFMRIRRSIMVQAKDLDGNPLLQSFNVPWKYVELAIQFANQMIEQQKRWGGKDIFEGKFSDKVSGYIGQFAFHNWQSGDWTNAIPYINVELEHFSKPPNERPETKLSDAEINGGTIDIKTGAPQFLAWSPKHFGLLVPEAQFEHERKRHDAYVWALLLPVKLVKEFGFDGVFYGYALKSELEQQRSVWIENTEGDARLIRWDKLHPMYLFGSDSWNSTTARLIFIKDHKDPELAKVRKLLGQTVKPAPKRKGLLDYGSDSVDS